MASLQAQKGFPTVCPVERRIGEAVEMTVMPGKSKFSGGVMRERKALLTDFQSWIRGQGLETHWPEG